MNSTKLKNIRITLHTIAGIFALSDLVIYDSSLGLISFAIVSLMYISVLNQLRKYVEGVENEKRDSK